MPIDRKKKTTNPNKVTKSVKPMKTERTHEENQERAYIAASRRSDRSLEARVESARRASEIHKKRTGRGFRITEQDVMNEEMYEEEEDDFPARAIARGFALRNMYGGVDSRLNDYLSHHFYMGNLMQQQINERYAKVFPNAPQFPANYSMMNGPPPQNAQAPFSPIQSMYAPLQTTQFASFQQQQTLPQQFAAANAQFQQNNAMKHQQQQQIHMQNMNIQAPMKVGMQSPGIQSPQPQEQQQQPIMRLSPNGMMQNAHFVTPQSLKKVSPPTSGHVTPQPSPLPLTAGLDLGPLSASLPADVQQFLDPNYGFIDYAAMQSPMTFGAKSPTINEKTGTQSQEPEQLRTPPHSTKSIDETSSMHTFSPDMFDTHLPQDMLEKQQDIPHDGGLQFSSDLYNGSGAMGQYEDLNNFDNNFDWMSQDWPQQQHQPAFMFP